MAFSHDGSLLVIGSYNEAIIFKVTRLYGTYESGRMTIDDSYVTAIAIVEGSYSGILLGLSNGIVQQWDVFGEKCTTIYKPPPRFIIGSVHEEKDLHDKDEGMRIVGIVALNTEGVTNETRNTQEGDFAVLHENRTVAVWKAFPSELNEDQQASSGYPGYHDWFMCSSFTKQWHHCIWRQ